MSFGLDFVTAPSIAAMKAANVAFVCRYLSEVNELTKIKLLTPEEAKADSAAGIALVSNFEWYANRALEGFASGVQDAQIADAQHKACGGPADRPIYFSVDFNASITQMPAIREYFRGVASVIGLERTGAYGSYRTIRNMLDANAITWAWQTYAWSDGQWDPRAHIQQYNNGVDLDGHAVDYDRSMVVDFGQWFYGGVMQTYSKNSADFNTYFVFIDDQHIQCKQTQCVIQFDILAHYCRLSMDGQTLPILGLPRTSEIYITLADGKQIVIQIFERGILCYDPGHLLDAQPGMQEVYLVHIDQVANPGMLQLSKLLGVSMQPASVVDTSALITAINAIPTGLTPLIDAVLVEAKKL